MESDRVPAGRKSKESEKQLETLTKGLQVLDCLQGRPEMTLTEIASELGLYKSRVMRLCGTLAYMGYLIFDDHRRVYRLGPRVLSLGRVYENTNPFIPMIRPSMEYLYNKLNRTVSFAILHGMKQLCAYRISEHQSFVEPSAYQETALYVGATSRILLAFAPNNFREAFFSDGEDYPALTPNTITSREELLKAVMQAQRDGYAITADERVMGSVGIAAPVLQFSGILVGSMSISGNKDGFGDDFIRECLSSLLHETGELSKKFGYTG